MARTVTLTMTLGLTLFVTTTGAYVWPKLESSHESGSDIMGSKLGSHAGSEP